MKALFIGGTGLISSACAERAVAGGWDLTLVNRGQSNKYPVPAGAELLAGGVHGDPEGIRSLLRGRAFDVIVDWTAYLPADVERDIDGFDAEEGRRTVDAEANRKWDKILDTYGNALPRK